MLYYAFSNIVVLLLYIVFMENVCFYPWLRDKSVLGVCVGGFKLNQLNITSYSMINHEYS